MKKVIKMLLIATATIPFAAPTQAALDIDQMAGDYSRSLGEVRQPSKPRNLKTSIESTQYRAQ
jgi:hypothetical protein